MQLVQIEVIGLEAPQARFDGLHDVFARGDLEAFLGVEGPAEFRGEHDIAAAGADDLTQSRLRAAVLPIGIGRVEEVDAEIECLIDDLARALLVQPSAEVVAAEPDARYARAILAESPVFHALIPFC